MESEYKKYEPIFGTWKIVKLIGEGSYGKVYEIEREDFGVKYQAALKAITIPKSQSEVKNYIADGMDEESAATYFRSFVEEITKEFALMDKLKGNSYIVNYEDHTVIEHKDDIGWDVLIRMELLTPLNDYLNGRQLTCQEVAQAGLDLSNALEICDKYDIIHRDIKPENIFVSDLGNFKLGDFGIARVAEKTTGASTRIGTNSYMAPEVVRGENYDKLVDIYSLGLLLYRLLNNNRLPFLPPAPEPVTYSQREEANARRLRGEALPAPVNSDERLAEIILKAASADKNKRYQSASDLRADLEDYLGLKTKVTADADLISLNNNGAIPDLEDDEKTIASPMVQAEKEISSEVAAQDVFAEEKTEVKNVIHEEIKEETEEEICVETKDEGMNPSSSRNSFIKQLFTFKPVARGAGAFGIAILVTVIVAAIIGYKPAYFGLNQNLSLDGIRVLVLILSSIISAYAVTKFGSFLWGILYSIAGSYLLIVGYLTSLQFSHFGRINIDQLKSFFRYWFALDIFPMGLLPIMAMLAAFITALVKFRISGNKRN